MFKFLQRIFGKSSSSYESLMDSRDPKIELSEAVIKQAVTAMEPIILTGYSLKREPQTKSVPPRMPRDTSWPVNKKGVPLLYLGTVNASNFKIAIFEHEDGLKKEESNFQVVYISSNLNDQLIDLEPKHSGLIATNRYHQNEIKSLPIWEELIHRFPEIHKLIVKLAPENPWTLYKMAKKQLCGTPILEQLEGYPQWVINDVDFRKVKQTEFLIQITEIGNNQNIYVFIENNVVFKIDQRL